MKDLISRQDAIDAVVKYGKQIPTFAIAVKDALENLPSAQPETQKLLDDGTLIVHTDIDIIKITRVNITQNNTHYGDLFYQDDDTRRKGKWINAYPDIEPNPMFMYGICSACGYEQAISDKLNFCSNCGADMRQRDDEG